MNTNTYTVQIDPKLNKQVRAWYYFGRMEMTEFERVLECMTRHQLLAMWLGAEDTANNVDAADRARESINRVATRTHGADWLEVAMHTTDGFNKYYVSRMGGVYTSQTSR